MGKGKKISQVPVGLERVLYLAATEPAFKAALMADPEAAAAGRGLNLRPSELAMLRVVPLDMLERHIKSLDASPENLGRRTFMGAVAASAMTVAAADALSGCGTTAEKGIRPDLPVTARDSGAARDTVPAPDSVGPAPTGIRPGGG